MRNKYITYEHYLKQEQKIKQLSALGVRFIYKKSKVKIILGSICLFIAIVPNGLGIIFYPLGFALLSSAGVDIYSLLRTKKREIRVLISNLRRWAKC